MGLTKEEFRSYWPDHKCRLFEFFMRKKAMAEKTEKDPKKTATEILNKDTTLTSGAWLNMVGEELDKVRKGRFPGPSAAGGQLSYEEGHLLQALDNLRSAVLVLGMDVAKLRDDLKSYLP